MNARPLTARIAVAGLALGTLALGIAVPAAQATPPAAVALSDRAAVTAPDPAALQALLARLPDGVSEGALVRLAGKGVRTTWTGTAGPVAADAQLPIGSITKIFTNTLVLRLVAENKLSIDAPVRRYLPDLLPAAYDGVTVRQLMDHTADLPRVAGGPADPRTVVLASFAADAAARPGRVPAPGTVQQYNGLNSFVAGLLVERITGRAYGDELHRQLLRPLNLRETRLSTDPATAWFWAEGGLLSTAADLDRFLDALLRGRLLPPAQQQHLFEVPDVPNAPQNTCLSPTACFSAGGLMRADADGTTVWGKTGSGPGWTSGMFATAHGERRLVYAYNPSATADRRQHLQRVLEFVEAGLGG